MAVRRLAPVLMLAVAAAACGSDSAADPTTTLTNSAGPTSTERDSIDASAAESVSAGAVDERTRVIVDYSPTSSDVAALMYVTQHPSADLLAVTLAGTGESHCADGISHTRALLDSVGLADVPVACGVDQPIGPGNEWPTDWVDAADRLDGLDLPDPGTNSDEGTDAADLLASLASTGAPITIIALAPLTNLAVAIERDDEFSMHVARVVTMGGAVAVDGNAPNSAAEWNYFIDPTAVDVVLRSGIPLEMVPLDATNTVPVTRAWFDSLALHRTTVAADVVHDLFAATRPYEFGFFFWDELAAAAAFDPTLATFDDQSIVVDLDGPEQGRTRVAADGTSVRVAVAADNERFQTELLTTLNGGTPPPSSVVREASADEVEYFMDVDAATAEFSAAVETLFRTPLARAIEEIEQRAGKAELTAADEVILREFFTDFWTGADEHLRVFRDVLVRLDPPPSIESEHDAYVAAVETVTDSTEIRLEDIATRDAADLLSILWAPDESIEALNAACAALDAAGSRAGVDAETCPQ